MEISKLFLLFGLMLISALCGFFTGQQQTKSLANSETQISEEAKKPDLLTILQDEKVENFKSWEDEKGKIFFAVVRRLDIPCEKDSVLNSCQKLSIYNKDGKALYELKDFGISLVKFARLRPDSSQLIIEVNGGGTDDFLEILDYKNEKFTEFLDDPSDTQLRGGW